jgi:hypothetical protein
MKTIPICPHDLAPLWLGCNRTAFFEIKDMTDKVFSTSSQEPVADKGSIGLFLYCSKCEKIYEITDNNYDIVTLKDTSP